METIENQIHLIKKVKEGDAKARSHFLEMYREQLEQTKRNYNFVTENQKLLNQFLGITLSQTIYDYDFVSEESFLLLFQKKTYQKVLALVKKEMEAYAFSDIAQRFIEKQLAGQVLKPNLEKKLRLVGKFLYDVNPSKYLEMFHCFVEQDAFLDEKIKALIGRIHLKTIYQDRIDLISEDPLVRLFLNLYCQKMDIKIKEKPQPMSARRGYDLPTDNLFSDMIVRMPIISLSREEEQRLLELAQNGDREARHQLILSMIPAAIKQSQKYIEFRGLERPDLFQNLMLGMTTLIDHFDPSKGYRLTTLGGYYLKKFTIRPYVETIKMIRLPRPMEKKLTQYRHELKNLANLLGHEPSFNEITTHLNYSDQEALKFYQLSQPIKSLDELVSEESSTILEDLIMDQKDLIDDTHIVEAFYQDIKTSLQKVVTEEEYQFLCKYFGLEGMPVMTEDAIAKQCGCSQMTISRKKEQLLQKILCSKEASNLASYLGNVSDTVYLKADLLNGIEQLKEKKKQLKKTKASKEKVQVVTKMIERLTIDYNQLVNRAEKKPQQYSRYIQKIFPGRTKQQIISILPELEEDLQQVYDKIYHDYDETNSMQVRRKESITKAEQKYLKRTLFPAMNRLLEKHYGPVESQKFTGLSEESKLILRDLGTQSKEIEAYYQVANPESHSPLVTLQELDSFKNDDQQIDSQEKNLRKEKQYGKFQSKKFSYPHNQRK